MFQYFMSTKDKHFTESCFFTLNVSRPNEQLTTMNSLKDPKQRDLWATYFGAVSWQFKTTKINENTREAMKINESQ